MGEEVELKPPHIVYYSNRSEPCNKFMNYINKYAEIAMLFKKVCIDNSRPEHNIKSVPSIVLDGSTIYSGKSAFDYIEMQASKLLDGFDNLSGPSYCTLDDSGDMGYTGFNFINNESHIETQENSKNTETSKLIDNLMQKRASEIPKAIQRI